MSPIVSRAGQLRDLILSPAARPLRFVGTGGAAGAFQLSLLAILLHHGWEAFLANSVAFLAAAQLNFVLSLTLTWRDRVVVGSLGRRWLLFHASIAAMALVNLLAFEASRFVLPTLAASIFGIAAGAFGNYFAGDRFIFRTPPDGTPSIDERGYAA